MGECGCGMRPFDMALKLKRNVVLGIRVYDGCRDCFAGIGVDISAFTSAKSEFLESAGERDAMPPDEFGGNGGSGYAVGLFEVCDLVSAAGAIEESGCPLDEYATLGDWLDDNGLDLIQRAHRSFLKRMRKLKERKPERVGKDWASQ